MTHNIASSTNDEKRKIFRYIISRSPSVFVHLDPRKPNVLIPFRLKSQAQVVLQFGLNMPVPITDLKESDDGVYGTLSFRGVPFTCWVPWSSVFALVGDDAQGKVWHEDMPQELLNEMNKVPAISAQRADDVVDENAETRRYVRPVNKIAARAGWSVIDGGKEPPKP